MHHTAFATHSLPTLDQFDAWRSWYAPVFDTGSRHPRAEGFRAKTSVWKLDGLVFSRVATPPISTTRSKTLIRRNPVDHWCISLSKRSATRIQVAGRTTTIPAKVPFVFSLGEELSSDRSFDRIQLYLARDSFQAVGPLLDAARGTPVSMPEGHLLADYLLLLERNIPHLSSTDGLKLAQATQAMVAACLAPSAERIAEAKPHINLALKERVRQTVRRNLRTPSLDPDKICREAGTSRSQLYRLLEPEGGVAHYIQRLRLSESFALLGDASRNLPIGKVAELLCFADGSSFSRAFRREFGMAPSDVRAQHLVGSPPTYPHKSVAEAHNFSECLRGL